MDDLDALLMELERTTLSLGPTDDDSPTEALKDGDYDVLPSSRRVEENPALAEDSDGGEARLQPKLTLPSAVPSETSAVSRVQPVYITHLPKDMGHVYRVPEEDQPSRRFPDQEYLSAVLSGESRWSAFVESEVPDNLPPIPFTPTSTAVQQLDELMLNLLNIQSKIQLDEDAANVSEPVVLSPTTTLENMLDTLEEDLKNLGAAAIPMGSCASCAKPITGKVITALGKTWHPEHFTCTHCHQEIGPHPFFERGDLPYCQKDHEELFSPRCAYCTAPIIDKVLTALDQTWHPDHFFCSHCGEVFEGDGFHEKNGKPYCRKDFLTLFAPKCSGCSQPVLDNYFNAMNTTWHPECFVCGDCFCTFPNGRFFEVNGRPFCELDFHRRQGSICKGCEKPIVGRCVNAMGARYHPEHFVCSFCMKQLSQGIFREQNDKPYCHNCYSKLFV